MSLNLINLDSETRRFMLEEIDLFGPMREMIPSTFGK